MIQYWTDAPAGDADAILIKYDTAARKAWVFNKYTKAWATSDGSPSYAHNIVTGWERGGRRLSMEQAEALEAKLSG